MKKGLTLHDRWAFQNACALRENSSKSKKVNKPTKPRKVGKVKRKSSNNVFDFSSDNW